MDIDKELQRIAQETKDLKKQKQQLLEQKRKRKETRQNQKKKAYKASKCRSIDTEPQNAEYEEKKQNIKEIRI